MFNDDVTRIAKISEKHSDTVKPANELSLCFIKNNTVIMNDIPATELKLNPMCVLSLFA